MKQYENLPNKGFCLMKRFKIEWSSMRYGESVVIAETEEEARKKALAGEDEEDFEELDCLGDWNIDEITDITNE